MPFKNLFLRLSVFLLLLLLFSSESSFPVNVVKALNFLGGGGREGEGSPYFQCYVLVYSGF